MEKRISLEVTINVVIEHGHEGQDDVEILEWQFDIQPPDSFRELSPLTRAALWRKLRDEIDEFWLSAALYSSPDATWNWLLEDVDLE